MGLITIISGCPGSGKTSLARHLAGRDRMGVHVPTDAFYHFLSYRIDPSTTESHHQNRIVTRAFLAAANTFADGGYSVYLDGVIGPWWLEAIRAMLPAFDYVILNADMDIALERTTERARSTQASASPELVRIMHEQFARVLRSYERYVIDTSNKSMDAVAIEFTQRRLAGEFSMR